MQKTTLHHSTRTPHNDSPTVGEEGCGRAPMRAVTAWARAGLILRAGRACPGGARARARELRRERAPGKGKNTRMSKTEVLKEKPFSLARVRKRKGIKWRQRARLLWTKATPGGWFGPRTLCTGTRGGAARWRAGARQGAGERERARARGARAPHGQRGPNTIPLSALLLVACAKAQDIKKECGGVFGTCTNIQKMPLLKPHSVVAPNFVVPIL